MIDASGVRMRWAELPASVRDGVQAVLGDRVVDAVPQRGGFSPGTADRVRTAGGRRAFVKAVGTTLNEHTPLMHRREAVVTAALPPHAPTPRLLGVHDEGDWIALVLTDVDGRHPHTPWQQDELTAVMTTLQALAADLTPSPLSDVPGAAEQFAYDFGAWQRLADDLPADLGPWAVAHLDELQAAARRGLAALDGDTLAHCDVRADNLLLRPDGSVVIVDWPWACTGPAWLDTLLLAINVQVYGGAGDQVLARLTGVDADTVTDVLAGFAGFFLDAGRQPPAPGLPTVRAFQWAQGMALLPWLQARIFPRGTWGTP